MATLFLSLSRLNEQCQKNNASASSLAGCIVRNVPGGVFIDDALSPAWLLQPGPPGLGDRVASALSAVGITKQRAQAVASAVGIRDCGCAGRQAAINRAGYRLGIGTPPPADSGPTS
jgi:hypothetical protein